MRAKPGSSRAEAHVTSPGIIGLNSSPTLALTEVGVPVGGHRLLRTCQCMGIGRSLHEFESSAFGSDFRSSCDNFAPWFQSGRLFYAAIFSNESKPAPVAAAVVSVFVTHRNSYEEFIANEIEEHQLEPYTDRPTSSEAVIYFSTIICPEKNWLPLLYASLFRDLGVFARSNQLEFGFGFSIASTPAGARHLLRNGFVPLENRKYLGRYDFLRITPASARTAFWIALFKGLFDGDTVIELGKELADPVLRHRRPVPPTTDRRDTSGFDEL